MTQEHLTSPTIKDGKKHDAGKPPVFRGVLDCFPRALGAIAWVSEYGSRKYAWGVWKKIDDQPVIRYTDADARHLLKERIEDFDNGDSGLAHAAQHAWNALARLEHMLLARPDLCRRGNEIDPSSHKPILGTAVVVDPL